ncbi:MAG: AI-2E family transporter, partial [Bythopirellula sp.]
MSHPLRRIEPFYWLLGSAALVVVIAGLRAAQSLVVPFLIAAFIAIVCTPALQWLQQKRVPQGVAILMIIVAVSFVLFVVAMIMTNSVNQFLQQAPKYEANLATKVNDLIHWTKQNFSYFADQIDDSLDDILNDILNVGMIVGYIKTALGSLTSTFSNAFLVLLTVLFMLMEAAGFPSKLIALSDGKTKSLEKAQVIRDAIVQYISLKTVMSLITGI